MNTQKSFAKIRPILEKRAGNALARGTNIRDDFQKQLTTFFDLVDQAVASGDVTWMDPLLKAWTATKTETDLIDGEQNVTALLNHLIFLSYDVARENLKPTEAIELVGSLMPIYIHSVERVTTFENETRIAYISNELMSMKTKIERLDRSKSNFVSVAAHEFKTPLTLVEGYSAMLSDLIPSESEQVQTLLLGIHNGVRRLRDLVDDMIDVSLLDNNLMKFNFQSMWLNHIINLLKSNFQPTVDKRKQQLVIRQFKGANEMLFCDPERIYQALKNIVSNAIKYTPDGGIITIDGRILSGFVEVTVTDSGIGISNKNQDAIFEKFGQLGNASLHSSGKTKFKGGGPGLGLPISKGIIEAHGGSIWVESDDYDEIKCPGSTFHILLPFHSRPNDTNLSQLVDNPVLPSENSGVV